MSERFESDRCFNQTRTSFETSLLGLSNFRPESHVAQQSRRDKLRFQHHSNPSFIEPGININPDLLQVRNVRNCDLMYDPVMYSSSLGMLNYSNTHGLQQESAEDRNGRSSVGTEDTPFVCHPVHSYFNPPAKASDPNNPGYWKGFGSQQNCDWIDSSFVGGILSGTVKENTIPSPTLYSKPASIGYEDLRSPLVNPANEISGEMQFSSPPLFYQNTLQEVVTSSGIGRQGFEMASVSQQRARETGNSWVNDGNELVLFPSFGNQNNGLIHKSLDGNLEMKSELDFVANKSGKLGTIASDSTPQGLSLSLSSHRPSEMLTVQFGGRFGSEDFQSQANGLSSSQDSKTSGYLCSSSKSPLTCVRRNTAPLGPFTGYAMILKCSKFLKPAQYLLDEFCNVTSPRFMEMCKTTEKGSSNIISTCNTTDTETEIGPRPGRSGISSSSFYGSNEASGECGSGNGPYQSCHPEFQQKKARLLYMQEEVCRRYKQYHQQMHIVVSSFESVAGLSAATPYASLALKAVSRHFRGLKNVISDQLQHINKAIGEDLSSPTTVTSNSKGETISPKLRFGDHVVHKHKSGGDSPGILQPQQHIWRPQRGLPERAVAILRAWLFEHFLHPYPTDTDKDLLASQTGLTRNQVSNWFINARVRVWKPMVEEIHMLETQGSAETNLNSSNNVGAPVATNSSTEPMGDRNLNKFAVDAVSEKGSECSGVVALPNREDDQSSEQCNQGKRLRMESQFPADVCGDLMGFMPYNQNRLEIGGVGAVSLTLGLRHSAEGGQQLQHRQERQHEHQLISHFGAQIVHGFVG
ncbi:BEL1-like homeodomain protein 9 [Macadamia integrifolia]|uniref:BEL1-like homeodomain protein 9 n=1 Tax=Macadamia integrifolia TaxID=60698 RepID=UPI001C5296DA|nr:BEL1-like homeodomain protein 9 [Macadamia integrifolia]XP_042476212.1 BEL1-like homeodomain protein 9 [Macadamia integrifolia]